MQDYHACFKANLRQGAPEVGEIPDVPSRITKFEVPIDALKYAPTTGVKAFHHAMANRYNMQYRQPDSPISSLHATPQPVPQRGKTESGSSSRHLLYPLAHSQWILRVIYGKMLYHTLLISQTGEWI